jgi:hypothetical protein
MSDKSSASSALILPVLSLTSIAVFDGRARGTHGSATIRDIPVREFINHHARRSVIEHFSCSTASPWHQHRHFVWGLLRRARRLQRLRILFLVSMYDLTQSVGPILHGGTIRIAGVCPCDGREIKTSVELEVEMTGFVHQHRSCRPASTSLSNIDVLSQHRQRAQSVHPQGLNPIPAQSLRRSCVRR